MNYQAQFNVSTKAAKDDVWIPILRGLNLAATIIDLGVGIFWILQGFDPNDIIFASLHLIVSSFSILYYATPEVKQSSAFLGLAEIVSYIAIAAMVTNLIVLFFPAYIDFKNAFTAFMMMTGPAGLASIMLLVLMNAELSEARRLQVV